MPPALTTLRFPPMPPALTTLRFPSMPPALTTLRFPSMPPALTTLRFPPMPPALTMLRFPPIPPGFPPVPPAFTKRSRRRCRQRRDESKFVSRQDFHCPGMGCRALTSRGGTLQFRARDAGIAQLVEHDLAKVGVASSSLVSRSILQ